MNRQRGFGEYSPIVDFNKALDEGYTFKYLTANEIKFLKENGGSFWKNVIYMIKKHNPITDIIRMFGTLFYGRVGSSSIEKLEDHDAFLKLHYLALFFSISALFSGNFISSIFASVDSLLNLHVGVTRNISLDERENKKVIAELEETYKRFEKQMLDVISQAEKNDDPKMESRFRDGLKRLQYTYAMLAANNKYSKTRISMV